MKVFAAPLSVFKVFPGRSCHYLVDEKSDPLVVGRIQPKKLLENPLGLVKAPETPKTQSVAVHAAQKRSVVDEAPGQHAGKVLTQRQLADAEAHFVVADGIPVSSAS